MLTDTADGRRASLIIRFIQTETLTRQRAFRTFAQRMTDTTDPVHSLRDGLITESRHGILTPLPTYLAAMTEAGLGGDVDWGQVARYLLHPDSVDAESA